MTKLEEMQNKLVNLIKDVQAKLDADRLDEAEQIRDQIKTTKNKIDQQIFLDERVKMRNIAKLGNLIREGAKAQKIKREELKKEHPVGNLGRRMPGKNGVQTEA